MSNGLYNEKLRRTGLIFHFPRGWLVLLLLWLEIDCETFCLPFVGFCGNCPSTLATPPEDTLLILRNINLLTTPCGGDGAIPQAPLQMEICINVVFCLVAGDSGAGDRLHSSTLNMPRAELGCRLYLSSLHRNFPPCSLHPLYGPGVF